MKDGFTFMVVFILITLLSLTAGFQTSKFLHSKDRKVEHKSAFEGCIPLTEAQVKIIYLSGWKNGWVMAKTPGTFFKQIKEDSARFANMVKEFPKIKADGHL